MRLLVILAATSKAYTIAFRVPRLLVVLHQVKYQLGNAFAVTSGDVLDSLCDPTSAR